MLDDYTIRQRHSMEAARFPLPGQHAANPLCMTAGLEAILASTRQHHPEVDWHMSPLPLTAGSARFQTAPILPVFDLVADARS